MTGLAETIGRYHRVRSLGRGGQGQVDEAVLHGPGGLRKRVALKLLAGGDGLRREASIAGLLRHPHLVDVYEVGEQDGVWFCAMELCSGGSLAERGALPPRAVVEIGLQVCAALQYAHEELALVHLDLKPSNLLLDGEVVKVADLGMAQAAGFSDRRRGGTLGYMAPEQAQGRPVDARSGVFALGVTLVELATGRRLVPSAPTFDLDAGEDAGAAAPSPGPPPACQPD